MLLRLYDGSIDRMTNVQSDCYGDGARSRIFESE